MLTAKPIELRDANEFVNQLHRSPCWHCKHYAAQCYITGDYWQWCGPKEG